MPWAAGRGMRPPPVPPGMGCGGAGERGSSRSRGKKRDVPSSSRMAFLTTSRVDRKRSRARKAAWMESDAEVEEIDMRKRTSSGWNLRFQWGWTRRGAGGLRDFVGACSIPRGR